MLEILSIGIPIEVAAGSWERPSTVEVEVDYVTAGGRGQEAIWECAAARNDVMLDFLEGVYVCWKRLTD
jgi:hypothetical protein